MFAIVIKYALKIMVFSISKLKLIFIIVIIHFALMLVTKNEILFGL